MDKFKINEIAIFTPSLETCNPSLLERDGEDVQIIDPLGANLNFPRHFIPMYGVRFSCGREAWAVEASLRKKKPPEENINWVEKLNLTVPNKDKVEVEA